MADINDFGFGSDRTNPNMWACIFKRGVWEAIDLRYNILTIKSNVQA